MTFNNIADYIQLKDRGQTKGLTPRKQRTLHQRKQLQLHLQDQQHRVLRRQQNPNATHHRGNERRLSKYQLQCSRQWGRRWEPCIQIKLIMNRWVSISRKQKPNFSAIHFFPLKFNLLTSFHFILKINDLQRSSHS